MLEQQQNQPQVYKPSILSAISSNGGDAQYGAAQACGEIAEQILSQVEVEDIAFIIFHCSTSFNLADTASYIDQYFNKTIVVGCTSAGEFNGDGYTTGHIVATAFMKTTFTASSALVKEIDRLRFADSHSIASNLRQQIRLKDSDFDPQKSFVISFLDGLSMHEEVFLNSFASVFGHIPHFGGSAGDDLALEKTFVYANGQFHQNCAVLLLVSSKKPFAVFSNDHINNPVSKLVVTKADVESRTVYEINGEPAAECYAKLLGKQINELTPDVFSVFPLAVMVGNRYFIRSIQQVDLQTKGITFYCAVDTGIILNFVQLGDMVESLSQELVQLEQCMGKPELVYACDCFLRRVEIDQAARNDEIKAIHQRYNVVGFNAYGEHINSIHLNQTFTGVYFARN